MKSSKICIFRYFLDDSIRTGNARYRGYIVRKKCGALQRESVVVAAAVSGKSKKKKLKKAASSTLSYSTCRTVKLRLRPISLIKYKCTPEIGESGARRNPSKWDCFHGPEKKIVKGGPFCPTQLQQPRQGKVHSRAKDEYTVPCISRRSLSATGPRALNELFFLSIQLTHFIAARGLRATAVKLNV